MKSFLINLDRSPERLALMHEHFDRAGVSFTRIPAVDAKALSDNEIAAFVGARPLVSAEAWGRSQVGAFFSHAAAWERIASGDEPAAAVFEDDVHLAADIGALLASTAWMPPDADIVRLEGTGKMRLARGRRIKACPGRRLHRMRAGSWGAAGYVLTKAAAAKLLAAPPRLHVHVDHMLFSPHLSPTAAGFNRYQIVPAICIQDHLLGAAGVGLTSLIDAERSYSLPRPRRRERLHFLFPSVRIVVGFRP